MKLCDYFESSIYKIQPTRQCLICDKYENPNATALDTGTAWLCPECKYRIRKLLKLLEDES